MKPVVPKNDIFKLQNIKFALDMSKSILKNPTVDGYNFLKGTPNDTK